MYIMYILIVSRKSFRLLLSRFIGQLVIFGTFSEWRNFPLALLCTTYILYYAQKLLSSNIFHLARQNAKNAKSFDLASRKS